MLRRAGGCRGQNSTEASRQGWPSALKEAAHSDTASIASLDSLHLFHTPLTLSINS